jgi:Lon-like ATP-dependent protease
MGQALSCPLRLLSVSLLRSDANFAHSSSSQSMPGKGGLQLTGKLGEVIRESAQIGLSWVKAHAYELGITKTPEEQFLTDRDIHVHMPEGSIGKEGPSAGTAILSAFVSLFTKTKIHPDIGTLYY